MICTVLKIDGMMCGMCEAHINDCIRNNFNTKKVTASSKKGIAVIISEAEIDKEKLKEAIKKTGYELKSIETEQIEQAKPSHEEKSLLNIFKKRKDRS